jgi:Transposase DNA-binding/Transposase DDE domain
MDEPLDVEALANEVANENFADGRLNDRLRRLMLGLAKNPQLSLPRAFDSAGLEAAYRFFSNFKVMPADILRPHIKATSERAAGSDFLVVHDTTDFSYRHDGERRGLGRIRRNVATGKQAFLLHASLAIAGDSSHRPLGLAAIKTWVRSEDPSGVEYLRWEEQCHEASAALDGHRHAIHVMDREADDYQMFDALMRDGHRFVVRSLNDRIVETEQGLNKLRATLRLAPAVAERDVKLERRRSKNNSRADKTHPPRPQRKARLQYAAARMTLKRPLSKRVLNTSPPATLDINVVHVWEPEPPEAHEPVEWFLFTSEPIDTPEQQLAVVDHYRGRWMIEEYFKALKSGCNVEKRQLEDYESLVNLLATLAPIAYQMLLIRSEARRAPDDDGTNVLPPAQLEVLRVMGRLKLSEKPTNREIYFAVAALGGHIKYNGDPGWQTLRFGYEELTTLTAGWMAAKLHLHRDQ